MNTLNFSDFYNIWIKDLVDLFKFKKKIIPVPEIRKDVQDATLYVCLHEWGGYPGKRHKHIKGIVDFEAGLDYQLDRIHSYKTNHILFLTVTMSDINLSSNMSSIISKCDNFIPVTNIGMDFSGYSAFFEQIKNKPNAFIILTNSSVNKDSEDCFDSMLDYMNKNPDVGMLGVSSSSCYYHTLLRKNFNPHIQSFFIMTTIDVLNQVVTLNNGFFPGINETNKHLIIRKGEVLLSKLVLQLGYKLAVINEIGAFKFDNSHYPLPWGDYRKYSNSPNKLYAVKQ